MEISDSWNCLQKGDLTYLTHKNKNLAQSRLVAQIGICPSPPMRLVPLNKDFLDKGFLPAAMFRETVSTVTSFKLLFVNTILNTSSRENGHEK